MAEKYNMNGAQVEVHEDKLVIEVPLDWNGGETSTGKSIKLFSSGGWQKINGKIKANLTVIAPKRTLNGGE